MPNPENDDFAALTAAAVTKAQNEERSRIAAINAAEGATEHRALADAFVAAGTPSADAVAWLNLAAAGTKAAVAAKKPDENPEAAKAAEENRRLQAAAAAGLGLGTPETTDKQKAAGGWAKHRAHAERGVATA